MPDEISGKGELFYVYDRINKPKVKEEVAQLVQWLKNHFEKLRDHAETVDKRVRDEPSGWRTKGLTPDILENGKKKLAIIMEKYGEYLKKMYRKMEAKRAREHEGGIGNTLLQKLCEEKSVTIEMLQLALWCKSIQLDVKDQKPQLIIKVHDAYDGDADSFLRVFIDNDIDSKHRLTEVWLVFHGLAKDAAAEKNAAAAAEDGIHVAAMQQDARVLREEAADLHQEAQEQRDAKRDAKAKAADAREAVLRDAAEAIEREAAGRAGPRVAEPKSSLHRGFDEVDGQPEVSVVRQRQTFTTSSGRTTRRPKHPDED